jgi:hypothetical protein
MMKSDKNSKVVKDWFYNHGRKAKNSTKNYGRRWTLRQVVYQLHKTSAIEQMERLSGAKAGSKEALAKYQEAITHIMDGMTRQQLTETEEERKKWNEGMPPKHIQAK